jgi:hypothetical protein
MVEEEEEMEEGSVCIPCNGSNTRAQTSITLDKHLQHGSI